MDGMQSKLRRIFYMARESYAGKKGLYVLLFVGINLIEWLKGTQTGDIWMVAVNCTGLIMAVMIMSAYPVREFLKAGNLVYVFACSLAALGICWYWKNNPYPFILWQYLTAVMNILVLGIIGRALILRIKRRELRLPKVNFISLLWILLTMSMMLSAAGRLWPIWLFVVFGMFFLTKYDQEDWDGLIQGMINGTILFFLIIQAFTFGFRPYDEVRYKGPFGNCNVSALYYLMVYCMVLFKLHFLTLKKANKWYRLFWGFAAGCLLVFQFLTLCRTAWISALAVTAVYGVLVMRRVWRDTWRAILWKGSLLLVCAAVAFLPIFFMVRWLPTILHHPVWFEGEWSVDKVHSFDGAHSEKYVELDEFLEEAFGRIAATFQTLGQEIRPKMIVYASDAEFREQAGEAAVWEDAGSSPENPLLPDGTAWSSLQIRKAIYGIYLRNLKWLGHPADMGYYWITSNYQSWHAQNLWLQIAYSYGIPSGILLIVYTAAALIRYVGGYRRGLSNQSYGLIPMVILVLFFTFGLTEVVWIPGQMILFLFYFVQHPQMTSAQPQGDSLPG